MTLTPLATAAPELLALGYRIVPIMPRQKRPGEFIAGRWRAMDNWQRYRQQAPTKFELPQWLKWPNANIGIMVGSPVGDGTIVIAIDLDMRDPAQVARAVAALPKTPMSKTGAKGETLFFRAPPETKTGVYDRILDELDDKGKRKRERLADFLAAGRQTVAPPSAHPDGGGLTYRWLRGPVAAADLPLFDDRAMKAFQNVMRSLGWSDTPQDNAPPGVARAPRPTTPRASAEVVDLSTSIYKRLNAAALANLDAWVPDLELCRCQKARDGYEAVATWRASTTGRDDSKRKRNLSIQPNGIEDFGAATKYSPLDLVTCAKGLSISAAYDWLRGYITPTDDSGVVLALNINQAGSDPEDDEDASAVIVGAAGPIGGDVLPLPVKTPDLAPSYFDDDAGLKEWPDENCFPPGLIGQISKWICDTATTPCPILAYGAALVLVGTVAGRQFQGPTGTGTHLYAIGAAPTGVGKDHPLNCVSLALHDAGMSNMIGPPDFTADSAVLRHLTDNPLSVSMIDEFGSFWKRINSKNSGTWETAITRALREPWGRSFALMRTKQYSGAGPQSQDIWWPALSIFGMSTPGEFFGSLSGSDVENGMANRFLLLATSRRSSDTRSREELKKAYFARTSVNLKTPQHIIDGLKAVQNWQSDLLGPQFAWASPARPTYPTINCGIDDDAADLLFGYRQWVLERSTEDDQFGKFYSRAAETAQRVATIHAIGKAVGRSSYNKDAPKLDYADVEHAVSIVDWSLRTLWERISAHEAPASFRDTVKAIYRAIYRRGGEASRTDLRQSLHGSAKRDLEDAITELEEAGYISVKSTKENPKAKKPTTVYKIIANPSWAGQ